MIIFVLSKEENGKEHCDNCRNYKEAEYMVQERAACDCYNIRICVVKDKETDFVPNFFSYLGAALGGHCYMLRLKDILSWI